MRAALVYDCTLPFVHFDNEFTSKERDAETGLVCVAKIESSEGKPAGANLVSRSRVVQFSKVLADGVMRTRWTAFDFGQNRR
ncbi:MAG: hypothetical protein JWO19_1388 [Bryobacterales bacterium]|nr:hypothetical protein [Bryobacterales bacterium]